MRLPIRLLPFALFLACAPEGTPDGPVGGTIIIGAAADADALVPSLVGSIPGRVASELMFERLADLGPTLDVARDSAFEPRLAQHWAWSSDSLSITFHLDPKARWHDGQRVVAADVRTGFAVIRDTLNGSPLVANVRGIDSISAPDEGTAVVHFSKRDAEQFYAATQVFPLPTHLIGALAPGALRASGFAKAPVGNGRYKFVAWEPRVRLELRAFDDHYRGRARLDRVVLSATPDPRSGLARFWAGETDVWEPLTPPDLPEAARHEQVRVVNGPGYDYGYLAFNFRDPKDPAKPNAIFADRAVRRAITMAVDRDALRRALFDTMALASYGPFTRPQPTSDTTITQIPFDRAAATAVLDSLGWKPGADGIRRRGRTKLAFDLLVPTSSGIRMRAAVLLQEQLKQAGVELTVRSMEFGAFRAEMAAGKFDATIGGWRTTPSPSGVRGSWGSDAISGGAGQNAGHYASADFDDAVQKGLGALNPATRRSGLRRAYQTIVDDAPAIWLYEIRNFAGVHKRLQMPAWRSDAWWLSIPEWTVDPAQKLPRDAAPE